MMEAVTGTCEHCASTFGQIIKVPDCSASPGEHDQQMAKTTHLQIETLDKLKPFWCYECLVPFPEQNLLEMHNIECHPAPIDEAFVEGLAVGKGPTPIACQQCSKAKAGCDKKRPCSRCKAKRIACQPRYARRTTKDASHQKYRFSRRRASKTFHLEGSSQDETDGTVSNDGLRETSKYAITNELGSETAFQSMPSSLKGNETGISISSPTSVQPVSANLPLSDSLVPRYDINNQQGWLRSESQLTATFENSSSHCRCGNFPTISFSSEFLPTPALSPTEGIGPGLSNFESHPAFGEVCGYSMPEVAAHEPMAVFSLPLASLEDRWPIAHCTSISARQEHGRPLSAVGWAVDMLMLTTSWEALDQHMSHKGPSGYSKVATVSDSALVQLGKVIVHNLLGFLQRAGQPMSALNRTAIEGKSSRPSQFTLPSRRSLRHLIEIGFKSLRLHLTLFGIVTTPACALSQDIAPRIMSLILAQGLLMADHPDANRLAMGILGSDQGVTPHQSGLAVAECDRVHENLLQTVAAWSGCGWLMTAAMSHQRNYSICNQQPFATGLRTGQHTIDLRELSFSLLFNEPPAQSHYEASLDSAVSSVDVMGDLGCADQAGNLAQTWFDEAFHEASDASSVHPGGDEPAEQDLAPLLTEIHRRAYCLRQVSRMTCAGSKPCTRRDCLATQAMICIQDVLSRWYDTFASATTSLTPRLGEQEMLALYSLLWLSTLDDVPGLEHMARRNSERKTDSGIRPAQVQSQHDLASKQVHCGQVLRWMQQLQEDPPIWWPLAVYQAILILWMASLTPCRMEKSATIDPSLILSSDLEPMVWCSTVSINGLSLDHEHIQAILSLQDDLSPVLTHEDGTVVSLSNPEQVLGFGIDFLKGGTPSLLRDGVLARLHALMEAWYGNTDLKTESAPSSMEQVGCIQGKS